ncbi:PH domain-containing protein [Proteocatella sphenisci]|uniref:PH domain-containing protein n=1 Tax=Proteocatella sphenisci TaxID=181070 RepID=UPI0006855D0A|nr:PH domain-containing protein [Proteocatella sphenisci]
MRVKSKIDFWLKIIILGSVLIMLFSMMIVPQNEKIIGYLVGVPMICFMLWIYFGTYYEFRDEYLYCRSGPFFERIIYDKIKSVKLSQNMLSSMALSTKRIEIRQHGKGYITGTTFISPMNREEFMKELIRRCNNIE